MQTIYVTTSNFIRHQGNVVDLTQYRRKLAMAQGQCPPHLAEEEVRSAPSRAVRRRRRRLAGVVLDCAASAALIVTALSFAVKILYL